MSATAASALLVLDARREGLPLAVIARLARNPLSTVQRSIGALIDEGIVVQTLGRRPLYRLAPGTPPAIVEVAAWRLGIEAAAVLRQAAAIGAATVGQSGPGVRATTQSIRATDAQALRRMTERLIWWQPAAASLRSPERLIAQVMAIGSDTDIATIERLYGEEVMRVVLSQAAPGVFSAPRWRHWHLRFGHRRVPPLPSRIL